MEGEGRAGYGMHQFSPDQLPGKTTGEGPADAITGRKGFGQGAAVQYPTFLIIRLTGLWPMAEIQFTVDVIFDERDLVSRDEFYQRGLFFVGDGRTEGIAEVGDEDAGPDGKFADGRLQLAGVDAHERIGGGSFIGHK